MKGSRRDDKDGDGRGGDGSSSDDDSSSSSSSSASSSDENSGYNSPTPSDLNNKSSNNTPKRQNKSGRESNNTNTPESKTWDSMDGYEIRKNALNLLNTSPDSSHSQGSGGERKMNSITYQSYQDSSYGNNGRDDDRPAHQYYSSPQLSSPSIQPHHDDGNLSVYHVTSLAFNCMVHCLTEGYRAASTYYNSYPENSFTGGTASATSSFSHMGGFQNTSSYENVSSYHDESHVGQVMDRETQPIKPGANNHERGNYQNHNEVPSEKMGVTGDYTTVKVPSYQGRK